jgi:hypothetical protein
MLLEPGVSVRGCGDDLIAHQYLVHNLLNVLIGFGGARWENSIGYIGKMIQITGRVWVYLGGATSG